MTKTMKALQLVAANDLRLEEVEMPMVGENEVLCKVWSTSICGTDQHIIDNYYPGYWPKSFPITLGHEWSGEIVELGKNSDKFGWNVGDRVAGIANVGCGHCKNCLEGRWTICLNYGKKDIHQMYGHITNGAYAEYISVSIKSIAKVPDDMSHNLAACMDPISIALHMIERSGLKIGEDVLINGSGAQGLYSVILAKAMGANQIFISGSGRRLMKGAELGAIPIDYKKENVVDFVMEATGGLGVMRVFECTGTELGINQACHVVSRGGCISTISLPKDDVKIPIRQIVLDEIDLHGSRANPNTLSRAILVADQNIEALNSMITHVFSIEEYEKAFRIFNGRLEDSLKVVIKPNGFEK
ncbi:MAG: zinc-dependent alcohol dehydrogenase [Saccharofermentanales bacterium]|jgi:L-iditol 2-dehydrogenase